MNSSELNVQPIGSSDNSAKPIVRRCANLAAELLNLYPDGLVLGRCFGIVGDLGLTLEFINADGTKAQLRFKADELLPIVEVKGEMFVLSSSVSVPVATVHQGFFKGFRRSA